MRVALIFDDRLRPDTTGIHARAALRSLADVVHFLPDRRGEIPASGFDLYLSMDDDSDHRLPSPLRPLAYWAIDTHLDFDARLERARRCDLVFAAQRDGADRLRDRGVATSTWLPLACDPDVHRKLDVPKTLDVAFVGNLFPGARAELLGRLAGRFPGHFIGRAFGDEMARIYSSSRVVFNRSLGDDVNMRVFEALACGSLLVTNDLAGNGLGELFVVGEHLVTYRDADDLLAKVAHHLQHDGERERIAAAGRAEALAGHTYRHRMEALLARAGEVLGDLGRVTIPVPFAGGSHVSFRPSGRPPGLTSVIVPCFDQLEFTRECVRALVRKTGRPWELIVVDNGSTDGTDRYLAGVADAAPMAVRVIGNASNRGFPAAVNQGLAAARGEYLVLLNNDAVVTDGWLDQLVALADSDPAIGMAGPMSNYASPPQLVEDVPYKDLDAMHGFAARWREEHRGQWLTAGKLSGFCLLMKRAVYEAIGGLDERFGLGFFDDDDLGRRARDAGFTLAVARDLFVHHFGSRTFTGQGIDAAALLEANAKVYAAKWGELQGTAVTLAPWPGHSHGRGFETQIDTDEHRWGEGVRDGKTAGGGRVGRGCVPGVGVEQVRAGGVPGSPNPISMPYPCESVSIRGSKSPGPIRGGTKAQVSLTMIVRDEEDNLPQCLGSVAGLFDEVVVVDTGSRDRTTEIARGFGARVFDFVWVDDFAAARNAALARARGDYAFWLDADDVVEPQERAKLERLLASLPADEAGQAAYVVRCACDPEPDGRGGNTVVDHIRLFPVREGVRWTYAVHEQILPALRRAGVPVRWSDVTVRHTGYSDPALRGRKLERDARILEADLAERPGDPFVLFNLGSIAVERQDWPRALELLQRSLSGSAPSDSITRKLFALIARCRQMLGDLPRAIAACDEGLSFFPDDAELLFRKAVAHRGSGDPAGAEASWRRILGLRRPEEFASVDQGIYGHLTRRNLAALAEERGELAVALEHWRAVQHECHGDEEALHAVRRLGNSAGGP
ncbi:SPBc2 prophage-derived glycosyltransferase SunS [Aquisphaera giovannonii]|uniref:SPBc2 prophage-derived glycosyltransferase SunS n=1 Tax=Aquisphaera giovannonii TaxID=406548 RepID=A0A5B9VV99_9BACT|nr:glycosyltransferase [Aquisphaera giovannonii]QEH32069.1 SPBc2 prophage-derived glycosyltransferase SunS [Aquisphaera giovannonii]